MTADIIDLAARRAERDAAAKEDTEIATYGIVQWHGRDDFEFYAEMRSGRRLTIADGLTARQAFKRLAREIPADAPNGIRKRSGSSETR